MNQTFEATYAVSVADLLVLDTLPRETRELVHRYIRSVVEETKAAAEDSYESSLNGLYARVAELEGLMEAKLSSSDLLHSIGEQVRSQQRNSTAEDLGVGLQYNKIVINSDDLITGIGKNDDRIIYTAAYKIALAAVYIATVKR